ncbi:unnamed protein product [Paramecium sonneborni]|uniref:Uncharacterized protein n=1 Tax=Paramecium sonneborni TaxID=65129 RepID=A0A8S1RMT1_9CILI|nr:unnamed protein product [Paramecium sonneborni]
MWAMRDKQQVQQQSQYQRFTKGKNYKANIIFRDACKSKQDV